MKKQHGFTLVEITVAIIIICALALISTLAYVQVKKESQDTVRQGTATVISEALEHYYDMHGEYPSISSLVNTQAGNTGIVAATKLGISPEDLVMPAMPTGATNPLTAGPNPHDDYIVYDSGNMGNPCRVDVNGGCNDYTLKYNKEDGTTVSVPSRH